MSLRLASARTSSVFVATNTRRSNHELLCGTGCFVGRYGHPSSMTRARLCARYGHLATPKSDFAFDAIALPMVRVGLEARSRSAWLPQHKAPSGGPVLCIETCQAEAAMGATHSKSDRNDARGLAPIISTAWYYQVHVKSAPSRMAHPCWWHPGRCYPKREIWRMQGGQYCF